MITVPADFPVRPLVTPEEIAAAKDVVTCGTCNLSWDDAVPTSWTPAPSARCPFEYFHVHETTERVTVWADGFGQWHAKVTFPDDGYGPAFLAANIGRIRAKARRAIRREIAARQGPGRFTVRVFVKANQLDHMNVMHSITFAERG